MTIRECYEMIGGDFDDIMGRFLREDRVEKFARMFLDDPTYGELAQAMQDRDCERAFRACHTLKGVCLNLSLTRLFESSNAMTEALRAGDLEEGERLFPKVTQDYELTIRGIRGLDA